MEKEFNYKPFLIAIIAIVVIVLISNNFSLTGSAVTSRTIEPGRVSTNGFRDVLNYMAAGGVVINAGKQDKLLKSNCNTICSNKGRLCAFGMFHFNVIKAGQSYVEWYKTTDRLMSCNTGVPSLFVDELTQVRKDGYDASSISIDCLCY